MSNGEKAGRVFQVFGVQLQNKFLWEQFYFCFLLTTVRFIHMSIFAFLYGVSDIFMSAFQIELNDYPHFDLAEDGTL
jgi:bacteriorhodopsin